MKMKVWEVLQKKISEMGKDEFINFAREKLFCDALKNILGTEEDCDNCLYRYDDRKCDVNLDCKRDFLESEYQPPNQEKWIVHRTLRTSEKEIYLGIDNDEDKMTVIMIGGYATTDDINKAMQFDEKTAIYHRDTLNRFRIGKRNLWVISKVEE